MWKQLGQRWNQINIVNGNTAYFAQFQEPKSQFKTMNLQNPNKTCSGLWLREEGWSHGKEEQKGILYVFAKDIKDNFGASMTTGTLEFA